MMRLKNNKDSLIDESTEITTVLVRDQKQFKYLFDLLLKKKGFEQDIEKVRKKWKVDASFSEGILIDGPQEDLEKILKKYKLDKKWGYILSGYICTGKFQPMADPKGIQVSVFESENYGIIKILPNTPLREVKKAFTFIKKKLPIQDRSRNTVPKNNYEDIFIDDLRKQKMPYTEVRKILVENSFKDDDEFDLKRRRYKIQKRIDKKI